MIERNINFKPLHTECNKIIDELTTERDRYRGALEKIESLHDDAKRIFDDWDAGHHSGQGACADIAHKVLNEDNDRA